MNPYITYSIIAFIILIFITGPILGYFAKRKANKKTEIEVEFPLAAWVEKDQIVEVTIDGIKCKAKVVKKFKGKNRIRVKKL